MYQSNSKSNDLFHTPNSASHEQQPASNSHASKNQFLSKTQSLTDGSKQHASSGINLARLNTILPVNHLITSVQTPGNSQTSNSGVGTPNYPPVSSVTSSSNMARKRSNSTNVLSNIVHHNTHNPLIKQQFSKQQQQQQQKSELAALSNYPNVTRFMKRTEVIGRGKFGVVYKAYHVKTKNVYAIKVLNLDTPDDEVEDVQKEICFLASLKQIPNVTKYYGSYLNDTKLWVVMEYCAGGSLRTLLKPGVIEERHAGVILREILVALSFIHLDKVIHRDIKAANVLITNDGQVKLCDFGVAARLTQTKLKRQTMAGTPYWMAPEVILEGVAYDTKADIWSLGITAFEIATGNPPYCELDALKVMQLISKSQPPRLEGRNYSALLKEFIALCLDEDPVARLTADDLLKSKFIQLHKNSKVSILKELITRYQQYQVKNKNSVRDSLMMDDIPPLDEPNNAPVVSSSNIVNIPATPLPAEPGQKPPDSYFPNKPEVDPKEKEEEEEEEDIKWDFDSMGSVEYSVPMNNEAYLVSDQRIEEENYWEDIHAYNIDERSNSFYQPNTMGREYSLVNTHGEHVTNGSLSKSAISTMYSHGKETLTNPTFGHFGSQNELQDSSSPENLYLNTQHRAPNQFSLINTQTHMGKNQGYNTNNNFFSNTDTRQTSQHIISTNNFSSIYNSQAISTAGGGATKKLSTQKRDESRLKAPIHLMKLFDFDDEMYEQEDTTQTMFYDPETFNSDDAKNANEVPGSATPSNAMFLQNLQKSKRPDLLVSTSHSQSSPMLPFLNTNLDPNGHAIHSRNSASTNGQPFSNLDQHVIEIEIPDELPVAVTPSMAMIPKQIRPRSRSSTVSTHTHLVNSSKLQRRPTYSGAMSGTGNMPSFVGKRLSPVKTDFQNNESFRDNFSPGGSDSSSSRMQSLQVSSADNPSQFIEASTRAVNSSNFTPSPKRNRNVSIVNGQFTGSGAEAGDFSSSPSKADSDIMNSLMQPRNNVNEAYAERGTAQPLERKSSVDLSNTQNTSVDHSSAFYGPNYNESANISSRLAKDFKKNNPNLKLQMPSPSVASNPIFLQGVESVSAEADSSNSKSANHNNNNTGGAINQFGFNTNSTNNLPIAMTPLSETPIFGGGNNSMFSNVISLTTNKNPSADANSRLVENVISPSSEVSANNAPDEKIAVGPPKLFSVPTSNYLSSQESNKSGSYRSASLPLTLASDSISHQESYSRPGLEIKKSSTVVPTKAHGNLENGLSELESTKTHGIGNTLPSSYLANTPDQTSGPQIVLDGQSDNFDKRTGLGNSASASSTKSNEPDATMEPLDKIIPLQADDYVLVRNMCIEYPGFKNELFESESGEEKDNDMNEVANVANSFSEEYQQILNKEKAQHSEDERFELNFKQSARQSQNDNFEDSDDNIYDVYSETEVYSDEETEVMGGSQDKYHSGSAEAVSESYGQTKNDTIKESTGFSNKFTSRSSESKTGSDKDMYKSVRENGHDEEEQEDDDESSWDTKNFDPKNQLDLVMEEERDHYYYYSYEQEQKALILSQLRNLITDFESSLNVLDNEFKIMMNLKAAHDGETDYDLVKLMDSEDEDDNSKGDLTHRNKTDIRRVTENDGTARDTAAFNYAKDGNNEKSSIVDTGIAGK